MSTPILLYCRAGFETEAAQEVTDALARTTLEADFKSGNGYVVLRDTGTRPAKVPEWSELIFPRQIIHAGPAPIELGSRDRVTPIVAGARTLREAAGATAGFSDVWIEYPDTNDGKTVSSLGRGMAPHLRTALEAEGLLGSKPPAPRLHVFLTSKQSAWLGWTLPHKSCPWPLGIPRMRMPSGAPSRSTLKLAEAFITFLGERDDSLLQAEMRAVDLGAAPGGWTWQLIHRGLHVTAVDNGPLRGELVDNALVRHLREDGFRYRPKRPVEWLTCDMVEQPVRIAMLVAEWIANGWAQHAIFNLKLPMKKRLAEVARCRTLIEERMDQANVRYLLRFKHLFHDREEVTAFLTRQPKRLA